MSDTPQGPGWWQASDDKWYPPEQHPDHQAQQAAEQPTEPQEPAQPEQPPTQPQEPAQPEQPPTQPQDATPPPAQPVPPAPQAPAAPPPAPAATPPAAPPGPPPAPTGGQPQGADGGGGGGSTKVIVGIVAVIALIAGAFVVITQLSDDEAAASTVSLEAIGTQGPNPFFASIAPEPAGSLLAFAEDPGAGADEPAADEADSDADTEGDEVVQVGYQTVDGSVPGLYGGTLNEASCDVDQLAGLLSAEDDKAQAWADVLEIDPANIDAYIDDLTPVNLGSDTRVVNHGFRDGEATPRDSILQRGTAVLVDRHGVPRVNCYSGAPLHEPQPIEGEEEYDGDPWPTFEPAEVNVVEDAPSELDSFDLRDVESGEIFNRPAGSRGESDGEPVSRPATEERQVDGEIDFNRVYEDTIEDDRTEANYTFNAPDSAVIVVRVQNHDDSVRRVQVEASSDGSRHFSTRVNPGDSTEELIVLTHDGGREFELRFSEGPAAYTFEVAMEIQDDAGQGGDAGDEWDSAFEISSGQEIQGALGGEDSTDMYLLELEEGTGGLLTIDLENYRDSDRRVQLVVEFEGSRVHTNRINPNADETFTHLFNGDQSGHVEIYINEGPADYQFTATLEPQADGGQEGDAPGELAEARELPVGETLTGQVGDDDSADYYVFPHPGTDVVITVEVAATSDRRIHVRIEDPAGGHINSTRINPGASDQFELEPDQLDTMYRMIISEGRADYTVTVQSTGPGAGG